MRWALALALTGCSFNAGPGDSGEPGGEPDAGVTADPCELAGVDETGACTSESELSFCRDGEVVTETCPEKTRCVDADGGPACQTPEVACAGVGPQGRCDGDTLVSCASGWPTETDCAAASMACGYSGDTLGYQCVAPQGVRVAGRVRYEDRPISPGAIGDIQLLPVRGANVYLLRDGDDAVLAHAVTSDDGGYTLLSEADAGTGARVTVTSSTQVAARPVRVTRGDGNSHAFGGESFALAATQTVDVDINEASGAAPAFNVLDNLILGVDYARDHGATEIAGLTARWERGLSGGSYYDGSSNFLNIAGGADDDGYDDVVILHEFGHHHQDEYGASDNPGGPHPSSGGDDPRLAWGEGQATYIAMMLRGEPYYIDTNFDDGGWYVELEDRVHAASMNGGMYQYILEWMVAELLWDVGDSPETDGDGDPVAATHDAVMEITTGYFHDPAYVGRGVGGVDLVDWLDGWFWRQGLSSCDAMRALVRGVFGFPYDFGACGG